ncbi:DUF1275 domain-containing protein [Nocardiopsis sp. HNM0947]|uniref:DUF1275 domain-containing protein n=1 Tax=Nocardiopsis coralli TaxID=2772213 RepID=A0ABR9PF05_9ACTN|nr:DUF1275 family protein [Nocardiopsis coralli]MBE3002428.1 DUF1275 domain-containing protein [Nocardiopsis coralli]
MRRPVALAVLTACAGGMDLISVAVLGGVFSGIITGNLVHVGHGLGAGQWTLAATAAGAVAAFAAGVGAASAIMGAPQRRTRSRVRLQLALQTTAVVAFAAAWAALGGEPSTVQAPALLVLAALAMGAQSAWARESGASTTYLTGTLTAALSDAATGQGLARHRWALARLGFLLAGAAATTVCLIHYPGAAALVPAGCAVCGAVLWWR